MVDPALTASVTIEVLAMGVSVTDAMRKIQPPQTYQDHVFPRLDVVYPRKAALTAARGESEAFQVVLDNTQDPANWSGLAVSMPGDLTGPNGAVIPASNVRIYREAYFTPSARSNAEALTGAIPDALIPQQDEGYTGTVTTRPAFAYFSASSATDDQACAAGATCNFVPASRNRVLWVDILVPKRQASGAPLPAGAYAGGLSVSWGSRVLQVSITLTVRQFSLPAVSSLKTWFGVNLTALCRAHGYDPDTGACSPTIQRSLLLEYGRMLLDHRVSSDFMQATGTTTTEDLQADIDNNYSGMINGNDARLRLQDNRLSVIAYPCRNDAATHERLDAFSQATEDQNRHSAWASRYSNASYYTIPGTSETWFDRTVDYVCDEPHLSTTSPYTCRFSQTGPDGTLVMTKRSQNSHAGSYSNFRNLTTTSSFEMCASQLGGTGCKVPTFGADVNILAPVVSWMDDKPGNSRYVGNRGPNGSNNEYQFFAAGASTAQPKELWWYQSCALQGCSGFINNDYFNNWPSYRIDAPTMHQHRAQEWLTYLYGATGELYYDVASELQTAWSSMLKNGGNGDGTLLYPGTPAVVAGGSTEPIGGAGGTDIPIVSMRLKMIREGLEDYEYLKLARDLAGDACARQYAAPLFDVNTPSLGVVTSDYHSYNSGRGAANMLAARQQGQGLYEAREGLANCIATALSSRNGTQGTGGGGTLGTFTASLVLASNAPGADRYQLVTTLTSGSSMSLSVVANMGTLSKQTFTVGDPDVFLTVSAPGICPAANLTRVDAYVTNTLTQETTTASNYLPESFNWNVTSSATVVAGSSVVYTVSTTMVGSVGQLLTLAASGLPADVTGTWDTANISAGQAAHLTVAAATTAAAQTASFSIQAVSPRGCESRTATPSLTVTADPGSGGGGDVCPAGKVECSCGGCGSSAYACSKFCAGSGL